MTEKEYTPIIMVDLAKDRIRVHRSTLNALHHPTHIMLIVNPLEKSIGIMHGQDGDLGVHKVKGAGKICFELYSKPLIQKLRQVCPEWVDTGKYKITGCIVPGELVAKFDMNSAEFTGTGKVRQYG